MNFFSPAVDLDRSSRSSLNASTLLYLEKVSKIMLALMLALIICLAARCFPNPYRFRFRTDSDSVQIPIPYWFQICMVSESVRNRNPYGFEKKKSKNVKNWKCDKARRVSCTGPPFRTFFVNYFFPKNWCKPNSSLKLLRVFFCAALNSTIAEKSSLKQGSQISSFLRACVFWFRHHTKSIFVRTKKTARLYEWTPISHALLSARASGRTMKIFRSPKLIRAFCEL